MPAPTGQDASAKNSDVHVIDIDLDVDQVVAPIDKSDIPVIHIDKPKQMNTNTMNGNGKIFKYFFLELDFFSYWVFLPKINKCKLVSYNLESI